MFEKNDIIQAKVDVNAIFTLPGNGTEIFKLIKKDQVFKISGINDVKEEIYLVEDYGQGAEIKFSDIDFFIKL